MQYQYGGKLAWVWQSPDPTAEPWTDGQVPEWGEPVTVRSLTEVAAPVPYRLPGRERDEWCGPVLQPDGTIKRVREITQAAVGKPFPRAPLGEMDRDFLGMDLSVVNYLSDDLDEMFESLGEGQPARRRVSEFHDLIGHMDPIGNDPRTKPSVKWNKTMDADDRWVDAYWTRQQLAERWGRYRWNDDYFKSKRIPLHAQVGWVHQGRFVYLGEGVFTTLVVKALDHVEERTLPRSGRSYVKPVWKYVVFWRESLDFETIEVRGRKRTKRVWLYHYAKTFANLGGPHLFDREGATAFADRLEAKAKLEGELIAETRRSMGQFVPETWDRDEFPYEPALLDVLRYGGASDEE